MRWVDLQEGVQHGRAQALHGAEVCAQQRVDEVRVGALPHPHAHGPLQHPGACTSAVAVSTPAPHRTDRPSWTGSRMHYRVSKRSARSTYLKGRGCSC